MSNATGPFAPETHTICIWTALEILPRDIGDYILDTGYNTMLTLEWDAPGAKLEENPKVADPEGWQDVPGGDSSPIVLDLEAIEAGSMNYYRLRGE